MTKPVRLYSLILLFGLTFQWVQAQNFSQIHEEFTAGLKAREAQGTMQSLLDQMKALEESVADKAQWHCNQAKFALKYERDFSKAEFHYNLAQTDALKSELPNPRKHKIYLDSEEGLIRLKMNKGQFAEVIGELDSLVATYRELGNQIGLATMQTMRFNVLTYLGDQEAADKALAESMVLFEELKDSSRLGVMYRNKALSQYGVGEYMESFLSLSKSKTYWTSSNRPVDSASYYSTLGRLFYTVNVLDESKEATELAKAIATENNLIRYQIDAAYTLGLWYETSGDTNKALEQFSESLGLARQIGDLQFTASNLVSMGFIYYHSEDWENARISAEEAYGNFKQSGFLHGQSFSLYLQGLVAKQEGDIDRAIQFQLSSDSISSNMKDWPRIEDANRELANLYELQDEPQTALVHYKRMIEAKDTLNELAARQYADSLKIARFFSQIEDGELIDTTSKSEPEVKGLSGPKSKEGSGLVTVGLVVLGILVLLLMVFLLKRRPKSNFVPEVIPAKPSKPLPEGSGVDPEQMVQKLRANNDWAAFQLQFAMIYPNLIEGVSQKHPHLTPNDIRILSLSRLGLSVLEMAEILHVEPDSARKARQRTRKKLNLDTEVSLLQYLLEVSRNQ